MKSVVLNQLGDPDQLTLADGPDLQPGPGQVLVRVHAAGVNFAETLMRQGRYAVTPALPAVLGAEAAGVVQALGEGVHVPKVGTRVAVPLFAAGQLTGGYAEQVLVPAALAVPLPDGLGFEEACALQVQGLTAAYLIRQVPVQGKAVVVHAAAGGVGSLLVQLARRAGARLVIGMASTLTKRVAALTLGAHQVVDYTQPGWPGEVLALTDGQGADVIFDAGSQAPGPGLQALAAGGVLCLYGALSLSTLAVGPSDAATLIFKNAAVRGFALPTLLRPEDAPGELQRLFALAREGGLKVVIGARHRLADAAHAHRDLESRGTTGKVVLLA